jgi:hypothetical protein
MSKVHESVVILGDSTIKLVIIAEKEVRNKIKFSLLFTSLDYNSVTNCYSDQWLRLWLFGRPKSEINI